MVALKRLMTDGVSEIWVIIKFSRQIRYELFLQWLKYSPSDPYTCPFIDFQMVLILFRIFSFCLKVYWLVSFRILRYFEIKVLDTCLSNLTLDENSILDFI